MHKVGNGGMAVLSFRSLGIGIPRGLWRPCMRLLTKLGFLLRGYVPNFFLNTFFFSQLLLLLLVFEFFGKVLREFVVGF